ncbi:hypothetical protein Tco_0013152 [Tanacetum coccineum]
MSTLFGGKAERTLGAFKKRTHPLWVVARWRWCGCDDGGSRGGVVGGDNDDDDGGDMMVLTMGGWWRWWAVGVFGFELASRADSLEQRLQSSEKQAKIAFAMSKGKFTYPSLATRSLDLDTVKKKINAKAENVKELDGKVEGMRKPDSNVDPSLPVPSLAKEKPIKKKRKGVEVTKDDTVVSDKADPNADPSLPVPSLAKEKPTKKKRKGVEVTKEDTGVTQLENEVKENTTNHDQNATQLLKDNKSRKDLLQANQQETLTPGQKRKIGSNPAVVPAGTS